MNTELKILTKKIRLLNEVMCLEAFFEEKKSWQTKDQAEACEKFNSRIEAYRPDFGSKFQTIEKTAYSYRKILGNVGVYLEKTIKDDKLAAITLVEIKTGIKLPLDVKNFIAQVGKIKIETAKGTRKYM